MNATLVKFGYPSTLLWQGQHWAVVLRPQQATLGAMVVATVTEAQSFSELSPEAIADYGAVLRRCERAAAAFRPFDRINFLTLMMVDPHVHTHVLPRYAMPQDFAGETFTDPGWPALPDLKSVTAVSDGVRRQLIDGLKAAFG